MFYEIISGRDPVLGGSEGPPCDPPYKAAVRSATPYRQASHSNADCQKAKSGCRGKAAHSDLDHRADIAAAWSVGSQWRGRDDQYWPTHSENPFG